MTAAGAPRQPFPDGPLRTALLMARDNAAWLASASRPEARLLLASALVLFYELALIRWHAGTFQLFSFYKNISLISCFLGFGLGLLMPRSRPLFAVLLVPGLLLQALVFSLVHRLLPLVTQRNPIFEDNTMGLPAATELAPWLLSMLFLGGVFVLSALSAVPLGQLLRVLMERLPKVRAYGLNLLGSLLGILVFSAFSFLWTGPVWWWAAVTVAMIPFMLRPLAFAALTAASGTTLCLGLAILGGTGAEVIYSPYQSIEVSYPESGLTKAELKLSSFYFQRVLDLSLSRRARFPELEGAATYYDLPYRLKPRPRDVLVVGAGTGNDVAAALRGGAARVDAVEIDPVVLKLGKRLHPEAPYADPRVATHVDDARSFIRAAKDGYDLIVFGLLDSHTAISSLAGVRQDSFVYTVECFRESRARLKPDGLMVLSFSLTGDSRLSKKIFLMLKEAFDGRDPVALQSDYDDGVTYLAGPGLAGVDARALPMREVSGWIAQEPGHVDPSRDDWPFFYLLRRQLPLSYLAVIALLSLLSWGLLRSVLPSQPGPRAPWPSRATFFLLGAGFMLTETRAIVELGLNFGNTWIVVAAVISGILTMAYLANLIVERFGIPPLPPVFGLLFVSLLAGYLASGRAMEGMPVGFVRLISVALAVAPIFFSGLVFSSEIGRCGSIGSALGANLFGAICGAFLEYVSLAAGIRSLYLLALAMYAAAFLAILKSPRATVRLLGDEAPPG